MSTGRNLWFHRVRHLAAPCCMTALLAGCYEYATPTGGPIPQGTEIRASLETPVTVQVEEGSLNNVRLLTGWALQSPADSLLMSARWLRSASGQEFPSTGATVRLARSNVARVETRRLSTLRTGLAVAGSFALLMTIRAVGLGIGNKRGDDPGEQPH